MTGSRILVVDEEPGTAAQLERALSAQGYLVRTPPSETALSNFDEWRPHLVFTDRYLPRLDGIELCKRIRETSRTPVVLLSGHASEADKIAAFDSGADDYMTKPFAVGELLARTRALLRRTASEGEADLEQGIFRVDLKSRRVFVDGRMVRLTPKEYSLMLYFVRHPNRVIAHQRLLEAAWGDAGVGHPEYLRVFVGQLRKKIEVNPGRPRHILNEAWVGYRFNPGI